jgi:pimeloyl-ACP methyl ester carboxylesterase
VVPFRSEAGKAAYRTAYERMLERWPEAYRSQIVPGAVADTHVIEVGPADAAPLILLPAVSVSAVAFLPLVGHLTGRRIIAADVPGDAGFTVAHRRMRNISDMAGWLAELIGTMGLHQPALAGHSYGGWIALGAAALRPECLGPVTVIAPASGLVPFHWHMALFLRLAEYLPFRPSAETILRAQAAPGWSPDPDFVSLMQTMTRHLRTEVPFPAPFDAALLASIARPLRVILAGREVLYDPAQAAARARTIRGATVTVVEGSGHLLPMEKPEELAGMIL